MCFCATKYKPSNLKINKCTDREQSIIGTTAEWH